MSHASNKFAKIEPVINKPPVVAKVLATGKSAEIASYYGFELINPPRLEKIDMDNARKFLGITYSKKDEPLVKKPLLIHPEDKVAILRMYHEQEMFTWSQPVMLYYEGLVQHEGSRKAKWPNVKTFHFDVLGTTKSIAEATLIKCTVETLREEGFGELMVHVNSIGDRDSMNRFCRELANHYRKHINILSNHCRQAMKTDIFKVYECDDEKCRPVHESAPNPINFLSELSRQHFREVLEYLESLGIAYKIHNGLICDRNMWTQTAFEIREVETNTLLATGMRYNGISKKLGYRKEIGAVGVTVSYKKPKEEALFNRSRHNKNPKVYFVQLGFEAKLKSLEVIEMLRMAKVPLAQSIGKDKISGQIQSAENSKIPHTIIMGQKEARENSVIVREMSTRHQETIPLAKLPEYLKKIK